MTELVFGTYNNWQIAFILDGSTAIAGFYDSLERPNLQGAIATARVLERHGIRTTMQLPDDESGFLETREVLKSGDLACVRICNYVMAPKAWPLKLVDAEPATGIQWHDAATSIMDRAIDQYGLKPSQMRQDDDAVVDLLMRHNGTEMLKDGASINVEQTHAMTTIDLNTGGLHGVANFISVFGEAIARALQVYCIGGAIAVDAEFLGGSARKGLAEKIEKEMANDPLHPKLISTTRMGLIEITRSRLGPSRLEVLL